MHFAKDYYEHYPKVALGHWPPMFYVIQSAWTLVFLPSRVSIMLLMAVLTSGAATIFFSFLRAKFGVWKGLAGTLLFLYVPLVQQFASAVMTEIPMTLPAARCFDFLGAIFGDLAHQIFRSVRPGSSDSNPREVFRIQSRARSDFFAAYNRKIFSTEISRILGICNRRRGGRRTMDSCHSQNRTRRNGR